MPEKITLLLADDHSVLRSGLRLLLDGHSDMEVAGEAGDGVQALELAGRLKPDVAVVGLAMPAGGVELVGRLRSAVPATPVLVLTMHHHPAYLQGAIAAGAAGFVVKRVADRELISAIRAVGAGDTLVVAGLAREAAGLVEPGPQMPGGRREGLALLSPREQEVPRLLAPGYTNQEIAETLFLSVKTVETHRSRIMNKLGLTRRAELVRFAIEHGLVPSTAP